MDLEGRKYDLQYCKKKNGRSKRLQDLVTVGLLHKALIEWFISVLREEMS